MAQRQKRCPFCNGVASDYLQWTMDKKGGMRQSGFSRIIVAPCEPCSDALTKYGDVLRGQRAISWYEGPRDYSFCEEDEEEDDDED